MAFHRDSFIPGPAAKASGTRFQVRPNAKCSSRKLGKRGRGRQRLVKAAALATTECSLLRGIRLARSTAHGDSAMPVDQ